MVLVADSTVFSIPFRYLWTTGLNGSFEIVDQPATGLNRFVGDESNRLLKVLAEDHQNRLFASPNSEFWPLTLHGPGGTGKTSLALALLAQLIDSSQVDIEDANHPSLSDQNHGDHPHKNKQVYRPTICSAADFDRRFRSAIGSDSVEDFRKRIFQSKGLFLDNLHQILDKPAAQHELLQIIDKMLLLNHPLILTMDRDPLACNQMIPQLASRLSGGLCIPVQQPGEAAREVIIRDLIHVYGLELSPEAIDYLVRQLNVSVPRIVHFFNQVKTAYRLSQSTAEVQDERYSIDIEFIQNMFRKSEQDRLKQAKLVIQKVASELKLKVADLNSNSRKQSVVFGRNVSIYLIRKLLGISFTKIGTLFGNRDHSTIMHSYRKIESALTDGESNPENDLIQKLNCQLTNLLAQEM